MAANFLKTRYSRQLLKVVPFMISIVAVAVQNFGACSPSQKAPQVLVDSNWTGC
jgi:hypothetical protein